MISGTGVLRRDKAEQVLPTIGHRMPQETHMSGNERQKFKAKEQFPDFSIRPGHRCPERRDQPAAGKTSISAFKTVY